MEKGSSRNVIHLSVSAFTRSEESLAFREQSGDVLLTR